MLPFTIAPAITRLAHAAPARPVSFSTPHWEGPMHDPQEPHTGLSRRSFLKGSGVAAAALGAAPVTALTQEAPAARPQTPPAIGPAPARLALTVNGQQMTTNV